MISAKIKPSTSGTFEFFLNGDSQWELNPGPLMPYMVLSELIPHLLEVFRPLEPYVVMLY